VDGTLIGDMRFSLDLWTLLANAPRTQIVILVKLTFAGLSRTLFRRNMKSSPAAALPQASVAERPIALPPVTKERLMAGPDHAAILTLSDFLAHAKKVLDQSHITLARADKDSAAIHRCVNRSRLAVEKSRMLLDRFNERPEQQGD
jgi:hypothetical protein